jgi:hypothetical protein
METWTACRFRCCHCFCFCCWRWRCCCCRRCCSCCCCWLLSPLWLLAIVAAATRWLVATLLLPVIQLLLLPLLLLLMHVPPCGAMLHITNSQHVTMPRCSWCCCRSAAEWGAGAHLHSRAVVFQIIRAASLHMRVQVSPGQQILSLLHTSCTDTCSCLTSSSLPKT